MHCLGRRSNYLNTQIRSAVRVTERTDRFAGIPRKSLSGFFLNCTLLTGHEIGLEKSIHYIYRPTAVLRKGDLSGVVCMTNGRSLRRWFRVNGARLGAL